MIPASSIVPDFKPTPQEEIARVKGQSKAVRRKRRAEVTEGLNKLKKLIDDSAAAMLKKEIPTQIAALEALIAKYAELAKGFEKSANEIKILGVDIEENEAASEETRKSECKDEEAGCSSKKPSSSNGKSSKKKRKLSKSAAGKDEDEANPTKKRRKLDDAAASEDASETPKPSKPVTKRELRPWCLKQTRNEFERMRLKSVVKTNPQIIEIVKHLQTAIMQQINIVGEMKFNVSLKIPRMEDGNNFGVQVQEEILNELQSVEDRCFTIVEDVAKFFVERGKLVSKVLKWPQISDWRTSVAELDQAQIMDMRFCLVDLKNDYVIIKDLLTKNMDKIQKPRSDAMACFSMY